MNEPESSCSPKPQVSMLDLRQLFDQVTNRLTISEDVKSLSWKLYIDLCDLPNNVLLEFDKNQPYDWFPVLIYLAAASQSCDEPTTSARPCDITVSDLLNAFRLHCKDFMVKLEEVRKITTLSSHVDATVRHLQKGYLIDAAIYDKFSRCFIEIYSMEKTTTMCAVDVNQQLDADRRKIWLLYIIAKEYLASFDKMELLTSFYVLLCCFTAVIKATASTLLQAPFNQLISQINQPEDSDDILRTLCTNYGVHYDETCKCVSSSSEWRNFVLKFGGKTVGELSDLWQSSIKPLSINSAEFLESCNLLTPTKKPGADILDTPVQNRLSTLDNMRQIIAGVDGKPSQKLTEYFKMCTENPAEQIEMRLNEMRDRYVNAYIDRVFPDSSTVSKLQDIPRQRFDMINKLYYKIMESLLQQEERRLSKLDFSTLLNNDTLHRTLVLCSSLCVCHAYDQEVDTLDNLIWFLDTYRVEAYHLCKVIECFIKAQPTLSCETIKHLKNCENHVLDNLAWKQNSPLYDVLQTIQLNTASPQSSTLEIPLNSVDLFLSPVRRITDRPAAENGQPPRSRSLEVFLKKVRRLGYSRLTRICVALEIPKEVVQKIWTCFECCIMSHYKILENRHLDQIMLCSIYAICKVIDQQIYFKTIVSAYDRMTFATGNHIHKQVFVDANIGYKSIGHFYNLVFVSQMKARILNFSPGKPQPSLAPVPPPGYSPIRSSPHRVRQNILLSPMKDNEQNKSAILMTPQTKRLYCFGDVESSMQLRALNQSIQQMTPGSAEKARSQQQPTAVSIRPTPSMSKRLKFD